MKRMRAWRIIGVVLAVGGAAARGQSTLPASLGRQARMEHEGRGINAGTSGLTPPSPALAKGGAGAAVRVAIAGPLPDRAPQEIARTLNLLRPDALFCTGDMMPGGAHGTDGYLQQIKELRRTLDPLAMPWYPCVGAGEVLTVANDGRQGNGLYQRYLGPLYYGVDVGAAHLVVLDSEDGLGKGADLSDAQLAWLKSDLNRAFERGRSRQVLVVLHRALWQAGKEGKWEQAHELLVEFNRRPIVSVEGMGGGAGLQAPRVAGVFAGAPLSGGGEYRLEPARDGIAYFVLGPATGAATASGPMGRAAALVTLDDGDPGMTVGLLAVEGRTGAPTVAAADVVTADERAIADAVQAWGNDVAGLDGTLDVDGGVLKVRAANPLKIPVELLVRVQGDAGARPFAATIGDNPWMDGWWETSGGRGWLKLASGTHESWNLTLRRAGGLVNLQPPAVEMVVRWNDDRGRPWQVVLSRPVHLQPSPASAPPTRPAS
jgi:hypothetical protein